MDLSGRRLQPVEEAPLLLVLTHAHFFARADGHLFFQVTHSPRRDRWDCIRAKTLAQ
jgi:hypothetical protein